VLPPLFNQASTDMLSCSRPNPSLASHRVLESLTLYVGLNQGSSSAKLVAVDLKFGTIPSRAGPTSSPSTGAPSSIRSIGPHRIRPRPQSPHGIASSHPRILAAKSSQVPMMITTQGITEEQACLESVSDDAMQPVLQESTSKSELLGGSTGSVV
jgi:hypothetical protein